MHILRQLRPNGIPVRFEVIYCKHSGKVKSFKQYNLSPEPGEKEAGMERSKISQWIVYAIK